NDAQQDVVNRIGRKLVDILNKYARDNSYTLIMDDSSQQTPVLFAANQIDVTQDIIRLYDQSYPVKTSTAAPKPAAPRPAPAAPKQQYRQSAPIIVTPGPAGANRQGLFVVSAQLRLPAFVRPAGFGYHEYRKAIEESESFSRERTRRMGMALSVGAAAPDFSLKDQNQKDEKLSDF